MNMTTSNHRTIRAAVRTALLIGCLPMAAQLGHAAPPGSVPAFGVTQRVADNLLPAQAKAGSGVFGTFNADALGAASVSVTLPDGREIRAERQRTVEDRSKGLRSWVGTFAEQPGSVFSMTTFRGVTTGYISYGTETWELAPGGSNRHMLFRVDDDKLPKAERVLSPPAANDATGASTYQVPAATADAASGAVHDILVLYTPAAVARYGQATLESQIQNAVQVANQAYQNSQIGITLNLVGLQQISYTETGAIQTSLYDLQGATDGKMDTVHALRDKLGADIVSLISEDTDACGIGWAMRSVSTSFASYAFNVVRSSCLSQHSLAHEVGHNQGNMHDRANSSSGGAFPYSYGFRRCVSDGTGFRTVMSYSCSGASRVAWFSNPNVAYNGYATGIAYETDAASAADNARSMMNTASTVAAFRTAGTTVAPVTSPVAPSSLTATAASSTSVTVRWTDNSSNESGFRLERSSNGVDYSEIAALASGTTSYSNTGLAAKATYYFRVRAYNSAGNSAYSNVGSVTTPDLAMAPAAPTGIAARDNADGSATVSWTDASTNETGFEVTREKLDARRGVWTGLTTIGTAAAGLTSIVDVTSAATYRYSVRAVNSGGGSNYVGPASVTVTGGKVAAKGRK